MMVREQWSGIDVKHFFMECGTGGLTKLPEVGCLEWVAWVGLARLADLAGKSGLGGWAKLGWIRLTGWIGRSRKAD